MTAPRSLAVLLCLLLPAIGYRVGGPGLWATYAVGYGLAAALAAYALWQDGELRAALTPRAGDASFAVGGAAVLYFLLTAVVFFVLAPLQPMRICTLDGAWVAPPQPRGFQAVTEYLRDKACLGYGRSAALRGLPRGLGIALIAALEEVAWRGAVQPMLSERLGTSRGWIAAAALFGLAQLATGNVAVALLALPTGLLWAGLARYRGTLFPAILSHAVFSWFFFYNSSPLAMRLGASGV